MSRRPDNPMINPADRVLFIDAEAIVIDKPAGLAVHAGPSTRSSLEDHLVGFRFGFHRPPSLVHRLDRDTSGCLLLARNPKAHKRFARAFDEGLVEKSYVAILDGVPDGSGGRIALALAKISSREQGWRMVPDADGKAAITNWEVLAVRNKRAMILFTPSTGRTHQLRVHAASGLGIPILGDPVYGAGQGPMMLHALSLKVPRDPKPAVEAKAPLPAVFAEAGFDDAGL
jgi:tRNA pseudouridine32 synthase/23S rRNA pseudouridine746 synthase